MNAWQASAAGVAIVAGVVAAHVGIGGAPADHGRKLPACLSEDAAGPCVWHAPTAGNGRGRSFVVTDGRVSYAPHAEAAARIG